MRLRFFASPLCAFYALENAVEMLSSVFSRFKQLDQEVGAAGKGESAS
jgi:hypothetical protein